MGWLEVGRGTVGSLHVVRGHFKLQNCISRHALAPVCRSSSSSRMHPTPSIHPPTHSHTKSQPKKIPPHIPATIRSALYRLCRQGTSNALFKPLSKSTAIACPVRQRWGGAYQTRFPMHANPSREKTLPILSLDNHGSHPDSYTASLDDLAQKAVGVYTAGGGCFGCWRLCCFGFGFGFGFYKSRSHCRCNWYCGGCNGGYCCCWRCGGRGSCSLLCFLCFLCCFGC